jgi:hypothetical protein
MPATLTYPGVYIEEISSGVHTITGVARSALEPDTEYEIVARIWNKRLPKNTLAMPAFFPCVSAEWAKETNNRALQFNTHVAYIHSKFLLKDPLGLDRVDPYRCNKN